MRQLSLAQKNDLSGGRSRKMRAIVFQIRLSPVLSCSNRESLQGTLTLLSRSRHAMHLFVRFIRATEKRRNMLMGLTEDRQDYRVDHKKRGHTSSRAINSNSSTRCTCKEVQDCSKQKYTFNLWQT